MGRQPHNLMSIEDINKIKPLHSRLTAIKFGKTVVSVSGNKRRYVICECRCGKMTEINLNKITTGHTISCGCALSGCQKGIGVKYTVVNYSIRASYGGMMARCYKKENKSFNNYGARGVVVCQEWINSYQAFLDWALANGWAKGLQLDKDIKGTGFLYSPKTCCWTTQKENCNYRTTNVKYDFRGENLTLPQICERWGYSYLLMRGRIYRGCSLDEALTMPRMNNQFSEK